MRFLIDNQLPRALAKWLQAEGHEAIHVLDVNLAQAKDNPVWERADKEGEVIVTKDEDFAKWIRQGRSGPPVLWIRLGNSTTKLLIHWFAFRFHRAVRQLQSGARLVELR